MIQLKRGDSTTIKVELGKRMSFEEVVSAALEHVEAIDLEETLHGTFYTNWPSSYKYAITVGSVRYVAAYDEQAEVRVSVNIEWVA